MEQQTPSSPCSPVAYVTAPNSPIDLDDFEFETCKNLSGELHYDDDQPGQLRCRDRGDSLPAMAFADELFVNGLVMPLKLPPRLQCDGSESTGFSFSHKSPVSSPRTVCKLPFARKSSWNDDFDPFAVALEKIREENCRKSQHRRSRSYSPFRRRTTCSNGSSDRNNLELCKEDKPVREVKGIAPSHSGPLDFKGSAYARWVRDQTSQGISPTNPRELLFGKRVRPVKEHNSPDKPDSPKEKPAKNSNEETKVWKLKGFLLRYASFGRGISGIKQTKMASEAHKPSYFGRLSFKFKENGRTGGKKRMPADADMAVVEYKPSSFTLCLGSSVGSPAKAT